MARRPKKVHLFPQDYEPVVESKRTVEGEPRVVTADVAALISAMVRPDDENAGASVALVAEKSETSTRTVYRVLAENTPTINIDLADRLCLAVHSHLSACRLLLPDGRIVPYLSEEMMEIMAG